MKRILVLSAAASLAVTTLAAPQLAAAQSARSYGSGDLCRQEQRRQANTGTVVGGVAGALLGGAVAGDGNKTEGALLGGAVGAVAGHQIAKNRVKCAGYPERVARSGWQRNNCRWVTEYYGGRNHGFEVCRGRDGVWRPSGRA